MLHKDSENHKVASLCTAFASHASIRAEIKLKVEIVLLGEIFGALIVSVEVWVT